MYVCANCADSTDPKTMLTTIYNYIKANNLNYTALWIDVEPCDGDSTCWFADPQQNLAYIVQVAKIAVSMGFTNVGFYSTIYSYLGVASTYTDPFVYSLPLWYAYWGTGPTFTASEYQFAGWTNAVMKQYSGNVAMCNTLVDLDYAPGAF